MAKTLEEQLREVEKKLKKKADAEKKAKLAREKEANKLQELKNKIIQQKQAEIIDEFCRDTNVNPLQFWELHKDKRVKNILVEIAREKYQINENQNKVNAGESKNEVLADQENHYVCKTCGSQLELKINNAGVKFWGCPNFRDGRQHTTQSCEN